MDASEFAIFQENQSKPAPEDDTKEPESTTEVKKPSPKDRRSAIADDNDKTIKATLDASA